MMSESKYVLAPDIDLDVDVVRDKKGRRITEARAELLAEEALVKARVGVPRSRPRGPGLRRSRPGFPPSSRTGSSGKRNGAVPAFRR